MNEITTVGLDLAKHVFQVHGVDASGVPVVRKRLWRSEVLAFFARLPGCLVGLEACATAHYWAREQKLIKIGAKVVSNGHYVTFQMGRDRGAATNVRLSPGCGHHLCQHEGREGPTRQGRRARGALMRAEQHVSARRRGQLPTLTTCREHGTRFAVVQGARKDDPGLTRPGMRGMSVGMRGMSV